MQNDSQHDRRIVLVDDEPRIHAMIRETLQGQDFFDLLECFADPVSFLEHLRQTPRPPALVLLDVHFENSGLSGIDIIPYVREDYPYLPIVLLTGMESEAIEESQNYDCVYYIPKPVQPAQLVRMVRYYLGTGRKTGHRTEAMARSLDEHRALVRQLKTELAGAEIAAWETAGAQQPGAENGALQRIVDILGTVLKTAQLTAPFRADLAVLFRQDFSLFKKTVDCLIRLDAPGEVAPGDRLHRHRCVAHVYSIRVSRRARVFFYRPPQVHCTVLLRIDSEHDDRAMDKWLLTNRDRLGRTDFE